MKLLTHEFLKHIMVMGDIKRPFFWNLIWIVSDAICAFIMFLSGTVLFGYVADKPNLYMGWHTNSPPMAFKTAICFFLVSVVLLLFHRENEHHSHP